MRRKLVVGNWKMYGNLLRNQALLAGISPHVPDAIDCAVCVPFPYLSQARTTLSGSAVALGAQNLSEFAEGAYTGEVSGAMLGDMGCRYVIVGHSERRTLFGEGDALVARKVAAALDAGLTPIVCVGESLAEREAGLASEVVHRQLDALPNVLDRALLVKVVFAYEPIWAVGTGHAASPEQVQEALSIIREWLARQTTGASGIRILYGGSVKPDTAEALFALPDSDGGLIGGASLIATQFLDICEAANAASRLTVRQFEGSQ
jgi:triosephosphate isomerase